MALSVDYKYTFLKDLIRKNQSGGLGSEEYEQFFNAEQRNYMDDLLGRFQARNNGKEAANTGLIENQTILQKLTPFIKSTAISVIAGTATNPSDFIYRLSLMVGNYNCIKINYDQRDSCINSLLIAPSAASNKYYFLEYQNYYQVLPSATASINLDYVSDITDIVWGFTYDGAGRQVYSSGTSTQSLWDAHSDMEICKRVLKSLGVSFKDGDFSNFGSSVIQTGD